MPAMTRAIAVLALIACGAPEVPAPTCKSMGRGTSESITARLADTSNVYSSSIALPVSSVGALVAWPADADPRNELQLGAMVYSCDGRNLGSVLLATAHAPAAASLSATVSLDAYPEASQLELMVTPLFVGGTGLAEVQGYSAR